MLELTSTEPRLTYREAMKYLLQRYGRSASYSTLRRWQAKGCRESKGVRLRAERFGAKWVTCATWLDAFIAACNQPMPANPPAPLAIDPQMSKEDEDCRQYLISKGYDRSRRRRGTAGEFPPL